MVEEAQSPGLPAAWPAWDCLLSESGHVGLLHGAGVGREKETWACVTCVAYFALNFPWAFLLVYVLEGPWLMDR